jgi:hypothetical protein
VSSIDGHEETYTYKKRIEVLPGQHTVKLRTAELTRRSDPDRKRYRGQFELSFAAKKGQTYTFSVTPTTGGLREGSQVCIHEEPRNDPGARIGFTGEFRSPGKNAVQLACSPMVLKPFD